MAWNPQAYQMPMDTMNPYGGFAQPAPVQAESPAPTPKSDKELREALESNRLYLNKVRKQCTREDFVDLKELKLFLFEVLVDSLEVNSVSTLGLLPDDEKLSYITASVEFLNSATHLEICERDVLLDDGQNASQTDYLQTIHHPALSQAYSTAAPSETKSDTEMRSDQSEENFKTKWKTASGKSCLFSMTPFQIIHQIEKFPVVVRVVRRILAEKKSPDHDAETGEPDLEEPVGYAHIHLPEDFSLSVLQSCKEGVVLPVTSDHREKCDVRNVFGAKKGNLEVLLRLTSFGPVVVTEFHTVGTDRKYAFKPSPASAYTKEKKKELESPRDEVLKPIIAEEDKAVGITVLKEADIFQKPVVWKERGAMGDEDLLREDPSKVSVSLGVPRSDISLCRDTKDPLELWKRGGGSNLSLLTDIIPPTDFKKVKGTGGPPLCDWHQLVGTEIENSPGGNCGCIPSDDRKGPGGTPPAIRSGRKRPSEDTGMALKEEPSRVMKINSITGKPPAIKGFGLTPEPKSCGCPCPSMKEALRNKTLFLL